MGEGRVWALTYSNYDDYWVVAVFSSEELALQAEQDTMRPRYGTYDVEEFELDPTDWERKRKPKKEAGDVHAQAR